MTELSPRFEVTDPHTHIGSPQDRRNAGKTNSNGDSEEPNLRALPLQYNAYTQVKGTHGKHVSHARSATSPTAQLNDASNGNGGGERASSEATMDPLSQVCTNRAFCKAYREADHTSLIQQILKRTNTSQAIQKLRSQNMDSHAARSQTSLHEATPDKKYSGETPRDSTASAKADKK